MVDYSKFDNIVLSSDEEEENERKNLEEHFENSDLRNTSPIIFADINQIPEVNTWEGVRLPIVSVGQNQKSPFFENGQFSRHFVFGEKTFFFFFEKNVFF